MKAIVVEKAGPPSVLQIKEKPKPVIEDQKVLIPIKAFGLNRAEIVTRQGYSPSVKFPRVIGIECVGEVEEDATGEFKKGQKVAAMVGGMGRQFDGSYAEYTLVPKKIVFPFHSDLGWEILGAIPEMYLTASGSLQIALEVKQGETLLIRGGSSSVGLCASLLAKHQGLTVISTTRNADKKMFLKENGADHVIIDTGTIADEVKKLFPEGVDKIFELVGTATLKDSLGCLKSLGTLCVVGGLAMEWSLKEFSPMEDIPLLGRLTNYGSDAGRMSRNDFQNFITEVEKGNIKLPVDRVFRFEEIVKAHTRMESNEARGKIVVVNEQ